MINLHLHHPIPEDHIRLHQIQAVICWLNDKVQDESDIMVMTGDFNAEPSSETYKHIIASGFRSSYQEMHQGQEPEKTFPTGLQAPFMDTDPAICVDFIFYRVGHGNAKDVFSPIKVVNSTRMGDRHLPTDPTIYGSDHFPIVTEFEIHPLRK